MRSSNAMAKVWRHRDAKKRQHREVQLPEEMVDRTVRDEDLRLDIQDALAGLPRPCKMMACYVAAGWSLADTANCLGMTRGQLG